MSVFFKFSKQGCSAKGFGGAQRILVFVFTAAFQANAEIERLFFQKLS
jgi:hypothetical protein